METHGCVFSTVATDAVVLQHKAMSIHSIEQLDIAFNQCYRKETIFIVNNHRKYNQI